MSSTGIELLAPAFWREKRKVLFLAAAWVAFVTLSYLAGAVPDRAIDLWSMTIFWSYFTSTLVILCDQTARQLGHFSLLDAVTCNWTAFARFLAIGAASGLALDGFAQWLGKLWIYPFWNDAVYGSTFVIGFCAYWLAITETYLAMRTVLARCGLRLRAVTPLPRRSFPPLLACGILLAGAGVWLTLRSYAHQGGWFFDINQARSVRIPFLYFLISFCGVWLALEGVLSYCARESLLAALVHGHWTPLLALGAASAGFSILMETVNAAHRFWIYVNWPWPDRWFYGVPVSVLLAWPLQYVVFLSIFALLAPAMSRDLWR